ncbi:MAG: hypothetical protein J5594_05710 [Elusimicrobiaceae bacterium]|nr:hypothetical protein [Elusimicrobiaceae bacterium]MBR4151742.1 hypothetical protein [Selenomonadaceae bacterium]
MSKKEQKDVCDVETALEELNDMATGDGVEISGRVYRINSPQDSIGRPTFEAVAKVSEIVDEDWIGRNFGGGSYRIKYTIMDGAQKAIKQVNYNIGHEYDKFRNSAQTVPQNNKGFSLGNVGGFLENLNAEKIMTICTAVKAIRDFIAPPPPQIDLTKVLEIIASNSQKNGVSEAIVLESLKSLKQQPPAQQSSLVQQLNDYKALKELFNENENNNNNGDDMSFFIDKALEYLPLLLQKHNNDYKAVGVEAKENPMIKGIINSSPELAKKFFETAIEKVGEQNANLLAAGFGYATPILQKSEVTQDEPETN